jgi:thymidylate synthase ThyX
VREAYPIEDGEPERAWKAATRAKALDLLRGLLPAGTLTNLGLYGNGRAFEYLVTKLAAHELPECRRLATDVHAELSLVIPSFVKRALDVKHGGPAAERLALARHRLGRLAPESLAGPAPASVRLVEVEADAERKVVAAALYPLTDRPWEAAALGADPGRVLDAMMGDRQNRRQRAPRALEHAHYTFEIVANFAAYRDLQRHRMLSQDRQLLSTGLGFDVPDGLEPFGMSAEYRHALERAGQAHQLLARAIGSELAQYAVPLAYRVRWFFKASLREIYHLCELRTTPQGHPDYRWIAQEMFRRVQEVHPRLAAYARFVDLGPGDELERRRSERRSEEKRVQLEQN